MARPPAIAVGVLAVAALAVLAGYTARKTIAHDLLVGWLRSHGVTTEAEVAAFGPGRFSARIRAGSAGHPDFTAETVDIRYTLKGFWSGDPFGLDIQSVRLTRPVIQVRWRDGKLSFGSLDPLIREFQRHPPQPGVPQPLILIEGGLVKLESPYGGARLHADARLQDGKLMRLDARLEPAALSSPHVSAALGAATLGVVTHGERMDLVLDAPVTRLEADAAALSNARIRFAGQAPYPDLRRSDGAVALRLIVEGGLLEAGGAKLRDSRLVATFLGRSTGGLANLAVQGTGAADGQVGSATTSGSESGSVRAHLTASRVAWTRQGGDVVSSDFSLAMAAEKAKLASLDLRSLSGAFKGSGSVDKRGLMASLRGRASGRGAYAGLGSALDDDAPEIAALKRAARDFGLAAPDLTLALAPQGLTLGLPAPVRILPHTGGEARLEALGTAPVFHEAGGAFRLTTIGGGLPQGQATVRRFALSSDGLSAVGGFTMKTGFANLRDADLNADGDLRIAKGVTTFRASRCAQVAVAHVELGENDVEAAHGELCQQTQPLFSMSGDRWRVNGLIRDGAARIPFLQARASEAVGPLDFGGGGPAGLVATVKIQSARLDDEAPAARFNPLRAAGEANLKSQIWRAAFTLADPAGHRFADLTLRHDVGAGVGGLDIDTGRLTFAEGGLQPSALSPLVAVAGSPARGGARFTGAMTWTPKGADSHGDLVIDGLSFLSPAGALTGLSGDVAFDGLAPLTAKPGQVLRAEELAAPVPVTDLEVTFGLADQLLRVAGGEAVVEGGRVRLEAVDLPLAPNATWAGALDVDAVPVAALVQRSPFGNRMDLKATVSGRVPFEISSRGLHISKGELHAIEPGRLSIRRDAIGGVAATGVAAPAAPGAAATTAPEAPNVFTDFAYQAMENLAFSQLSAEINSLPEGRLGVLFHIKGEHSPPQHQEIRVKATQLLNRSFLDRPLPLPSGVKVDLTLDTSLNLDQLLSDYDAYRQLRYSDPVQPPGPIKDSGKLPETTR